MGLGYTVVATDANLTGTSIGDLDAGILMSFGMEPNSTLRGIPSFEGVQLVPNIPTVRISVSAMVDSSGNGSITALNSTATATVDLNGVKFSNTYHTGGQISTMDLGNGMQTVQLSKLFLVIGECPTATS
jgi:hypothetical protein